MLALLGLSVVGCAQSEPPDTVLPPAYLQVIDLDGKQTRIPRGALVDPNTGLPVVRSVLAVDRRTGRQGWVPVEQLLRDNPAAPRYLPVTVDAPPGEREASAH
jgi:hypothetical protein